MQIPDLHENIKNINTPVPLVLRVQNATPWLEFLQRNRT